MIDFDKYGNLIPYDIIDADLPLFKKCFVDDMKNKTHRTQLFIDYLAYNTKLIKVIQSDYWQWVNGSFVTKALIPNDIDFVSFINYNVVEEYETQLKDYVYPLSKVNHHVDAYVVKVYPSEHKSFMLYKSDYLYWMHQFLKTKPNKQGKQSDKGFVKIVMNYEGIQ